MQPDGPLPTNHEPVKGLPPVVPPSGRHIIQLFVVPGTIALVGALILLGFGWLISSSQTPRKLLERIDDPNPDVRWRVANDLAQVMTRDDQTAADPEVALRLSELLRRSVDDYDRAAKDFAERSPRLSEAERARERKTLLDKRKDIQFLSPCLGSLIIPTGAPLLIEIAQHGKGADLKSVTLLRRLAVWALAKLGENLKRFDNLPAEQRDAVLEFLKQEADGNVGDRGHWARATLDYLQHRQKLGVIDALSVCAQADDPFLRRMTALALTFWNGTPEENALAEKTLIALSHDDGHGEIIEIGEND